MVRDIEVVAGELIYSKWSRKNPACEFGIDEEIDMLRSVEERGGVTMMIFRWTGILVLANKTPVCR